MSDHEETAREKLPCRDPNCAEGVPITNQSEHWDTCPAYYRPAVAAALAQAEAEGAERVIEASLGCADTQDAEIARLKAACNAYSEQEILDGDLRAQIGKLKENAEIDAAMKDNLRTRLAEAERERDAAEARGVRMGLAWASANAEMRRSNERIMLDDARKRNERERAEMHGDRIRVLTEQIDDIDAEIAKAGGKSPASRTGP